AGCRWPRGLRRQTRPFGHTLPLGGQIFSVSRQRLEKSFFSCGVLVLPVVSCCVEDMRRVSEVASRTATALGIADGSAELLPLVPVACTDKPPLAAAAFMDGNSQSRQRLSNMFDGLVVFLVFFPTW